MKQQTARARVMLVEDDPVTREIVRAVVEREGLEFRAVGQATGALASAREFQPSLFLLDVELPDGDGFSVCRSLRAVTEFAETPVLFLTSLSDVASRLKGFEAGAQDYVSKPFSPEELGARLRAHLAVARRREALSRDRESAAVRERLRQDMADALVHDIKAPLGSILITLQIMRESGLLAGTQYDKMAASAESAAELTTLMVNDLLDIGFGKLRVSPERFEFEPLLDRLRELFDLKMQRRKVALTAASEPPALAVTTDRTLVLRMLINLVQNAIKHSPTGGTVRVLARVEGDRLRVEVEDQGAGVPAAQRERIFEMYFTGEGAQAGHGIGLAFCRLAGGALGGKIWVEDGAKGGARFVFEVPARFATLSK